MTPTDDDTTLRSVSLYLGRRFGLGQSEHMTHTFRLKNIFTDENILSICLASHKKLLWLNVVKLPKKIRGRLVPI